MCVHISSTHRIQSTNEIKHHETDNLVVVGLVSEQLGVHGTDTFLRHDYATNHECTHIAEWLEPTANESTRVTLKKIINEQNDQFHQVNYFTCKVLFICVYRALS